MEVNGAGQVHLRSRLPSFGTGRQLKMTKMVSRDSGKIGPRLDSLCSVMKRTQRYRHEQKNMAGGELSTALMHDNAPT